MPLSHSPYSLCGIGAYMKERLTYTAFRAAHTSLLSVHTAFLLTHTGLLSVYTRIRSDRPIAPALCIKLQFSVSILLISCEYLVGI